MSEIFLFWDKLNDTPEILGEDGRFHSYGEDIVLVNREKENGVEYKDTRYWTKLESMRDITPLQDFKRFDIFDPKLNEWVNFGDARKKLWQQVQRLAGVVDWEEVY